MSFFKWFSGGPHKSTPAASKTHKRVSPNRDKPQLTSPQRLPAEAGSGEERKLKRHARREQLYVAIREAMTRAGVLSASYKFKVLSLDQSGDEFLVMMDLATAEGGPPARPGEIEALIVQNARARFEIRVPAVYWRTDEETAHSVPPLAVKPAQTRREPVLADEVAAFKQALRAASAQTPAAAHGLKAPRGQRVDAGFADTELFEFAAAPALSSTQYGDLM